MEEKLIIRLSNNIGNQMFMFAAGYATSKLMKRKFYFDNLSSYKSRKNIYTYALDGFEIPSDIIQSKEVFTKLWSQLFGLLIYKIFKSYCFIHRCFFFLGVFFKKLSFHDITKCIIWRSVFVCTATTSITYV